MSDWADELPFDEWEDDLDEGESRDDEELPGSFVDPGVEDEVVPEDEAVWLIDDTLPLDSPDDYDTHLAGPDE